jgi:hypothetical protein
VIELTNEERLKVSAVVHQNYYMPDVFDVVEEIVAARLGDVADRLFENHERVSLWIRGMLE